MPISLIYWFKKIGVNYQVQNLKAHCIDRITGNDLKRNYPWNCEFHLIHEN